MSATYEAFAKRWVEPGVKALHVFSASLWLGLTAGSLLVSSYHLSGGVVPPASVWAYRLLDDLLIPAWLGVFGTGFLFSMHFRWGVTKLWWVFAKWLMAAAIALAIIFFHFDVVAALAAHASLGGISELNSAHATNVVACASEILLIGLIYLISSYKPWGRMRRTWRPPTVRTRTLVWVVTAFSVVLVAWQMYTLHRLRNMIVRTPDITLLPDGSYRGSFGTMAGAFEVEISVRDGAIRGAEAVSHPAGLYPSLAKHVLRRIVEQQTLNVDAVTGATTSSRCFQAAAERALSAR